MLSPLSERFREEIRLLAETLNRLIPDAIDTCLFDRLTDGIAMLERIAGDL
jgi:hypothetical protein